MPKIHNTDVDAEQPWPLTFLVQGGAHGMVISRGTGESYETAFVEAFPEGTFLRGEGTTIQEAEADCFRKYETYLDCTDGQGHGPYEPRYLRNGCGFCVKCGTFFSREIAQCEESEEFRTDRLDMEAVTLELLDEGNWPVPQFQAEVVRRVRWRKSVREAQQAGEEPPPFERVDPLTEEEWQDREKGVSSEIGKLLMRLAGERHLAKPENE